MDNGFILAEMARSLRLVLLRGVVTDHTPQAVRVEIAAGVSTGWLPCLRWAGVAASHRIPSIGEAVLLAAPEGNLQQGVVLGGLSTGAHPPAADHVDISCVRWADGTEARYDTRSKILSVHSEGDLHLSAVGKITLEARDITVRTGKEGRYLVDHHGMATQLRHISGPQFETESWQTGAIVTGLPDHGYHPPKVED